MNRSHVTLPQILAAASTRHASMVPESAGYFMLGLCEAIGCLPISVPDGAIELSADGTVTVSKQGGVKPGPEAARSMRELFARLLAVTTGPTPRLAAVARPRDDAAERGVDAFAVEVEAALVPMNRAAGKRSLGRLARETLRAIESGALALHLQARTAAIEAPAAATAALAPLMQAPSPPTAARVAHGPPPAPITPPPSMLQPESESPHPFSIPVTPTTPGLGLETLATEAAVDSGIFGATPTYKEGDSVAVEPIEPQAGADVSNANESPGFDSVNTKTISCEPTQLSARDVKTDPVPKTPKTPSSESTTKVVSTKRRVPRSQPPLPPQEITLASAGVEPREDAVFSTPAPSAPEAVDPEILAQQQQARIDQLLAEFADCHDGQTQSAPKYNETLPGLAPVTPMHAEESIRPGDEDVEPLQSFDYQRMTPAPHALAAAQGTNVTASSRAEQASDEPEIEVLSSRLLETAPPSAAAEPIVEPNLAEKQQAAAFRALDVPSEEPGRVDELLGKFGRPEEGEDEMLKRTASQLKELAGLEPTPYAPEVSPAIRVPVMTKQKTPAWLPEDPRTAAPLEPAPLVRASKSLRSRLAIPFALFIALFAGFAVVHWRLPEVVLRWIHPTEAKQPAETPAQAAAEEPAFVED